MGDANTVARQLRQKLAKISAAVSRTMDPSVPGSLADLDSSTMAALARPYFDRFLHHRGGHGRLTRFVLCQIWLQNILDRIIMKLLSIWKMMLACAASRLFFTLNHLIPLLVRSSITNYLVAKACCRFCARHLFG
jgi:hypothetical protein